MSKQKEKKEIKNYVQYHPIRHSYLLNFVFVPFHFALKGVVPFEMNSIHHETLEIMKLLQVLT